MSSPTDPKVVVQLLQQRTAEFTKKASADAPVAPESEVQPDATKSAAADEEALSMPTGVKETAAAVPAPEEAPKRTPTDQPVSTDDGKDSSFRGLEAGGTPSADNTNPALSKAAADFGPSFVSKVQSLTALVKQAGVAAPPVDPAAEVSKEAGASPTAPEAAPTAFSQDNLVKLATALVADEEGLALAKDVLDRQAGSDAAETLIKEACAAAGELEKAAAAPAAVGLDKQAAFDAGAQVQANMAQGLEDAGVTEDEAGEILKMAGHHETFLTKLASEGNEEEVALYHKSAMDYGAMAGGEELPGGEITPEVLEGLLMEAVQSGEISEEEAVAMLEAVLSGGGGGGGGAGAPAPAPEEAVAPMM